jgi:hypothetical protein
MTAKDLEDTLAAIATKAQALRDAGVVGPVTIGDVSFELARSEAPAPTISPLPGEQGPPVEHGNLLDDPATYGGDIPRRRVRHERTPDDNQE